MKISRLKLKLRLIYINFIAPAKEWILPKKSQVLIYDACGAEALLPHLKNYHVAILAVRRESINMPCLFRAMLKRAFWKGKPRSAYIEVFFEVVSPKVVVTFIDNNREFYEISKSFPCVKTIFIQNGTRSKSGDIFSNLTRSDRYHVDYMLVHGPEIGRHYLNYLSGEFISIGSLKSNAVINLTGVARKGLLFISQWQSEPEDGVALYTDQDGTPVYWDQFYAVETVVLNFLGRWCSENNMLLRICGREKHMEGPEKDFYSGFFNKCKWEYIPRIDNYSSYRLVDGADMVVFIDSTLGYEAIGRGKKTASFSCRMSSPKRRFYEFGWPADLPDNGPFWTNHQDDVQFQRVMDFLNNVSVGEWEQIRQQYADRLMVFDPGNKRLVALLDQIMPEAKPLSC